MAIVKFDSGPRIGETVSLDKNRVSFGRNLSCDCVLRHPTVSREHFYIERTCGKFFVVDQGSGNGTFTNGARVSWVELKDGDRIQAGPFTLVVELPDNRPSPPANDPSGGDTSSPDHLLITAERAFDPTHEQIYPREYLDGIEHFNAGRYFESHESWEEVWLWSNGETKTFYQMLIQAAVGLHHYGRGNYRGARGMYKAVIEKLPRLPAIFMSLDTAEFSSQFKSFFADLIDNNNEALPRPDPTRPLIRLMSGR